MATQTLVYHSQYAIQFVPCQNVVVCLPDSWADELVSGNPFFVAQIQGGSRHLGNAFFLGGLLENPRGQEIMQYELTYDDTQFANPETTLPTCEDIVHVDSNPCELKDDNLPVVE